LDRELVVNETIELGVKEWTEYRIEVKKGDVLHYAARESFGDDFDLYLVPEENVAEHAFWTEYSLLEETDESYYRGHYKFKKPGTYFVVISNDRAKSVSRAVYVKIEIQRSNEVFEGTKSEAREGYDQTNLIHFLHEWKLPIALILSTIIFSAIVFFTIPGLAYLVTFGGGALLTLYYAYRREIQSSS
jgi:hypothetical protein